MKYVSILVPLTLASACLSAESPKCPVTSHINMTSGSYSSKPGVTFQLRHFAATLVPVGKTAPACFEKTTVVSHAEIFVSNETLTHVFAEKLGASNSKIKGFSVSNGAGKVTLSGVIDKVLPIKFTIEGPVSTDGSQIFLQAKTIKADGIPIKALLGLVGEHLDSVLGMKGVAGLSVNENTLSFSPEQVAHLRGHILAAEPSATGLLLRYGKGPKKAPQHPPAT